VGRTGGAPKASSALGTAEVGSTVPVAGRSLAEACGRDGRAVEAKLNPALDDAGEVVVRCAGRIAGTSKASSALGAPMTGFAGTTVKVAVEGAFAGLERLAKLNPPALGGGGEDCCGDSAPAAATFGDAVVGSRSAIPVVAPTAVGLVSFTPAGTVSCGTAWNRLNFFRTAANSASSPASVIAFVSAATPILCPRPVKAIGTAPLMEAGLLLPVMIAGVPGMELPSLMQNSAPSKLSGEMELARLEAGRCTAMAVRRLCAS
jgi:hypothetical protein